MYFRLKRLKLSFYEAKICTVEFSDDFRHLTHDAQGWGFPFSHKHKSLPAVACYTSLTLNLHKWQTHFHSSCLSMHCTHRANSCSSNTTLHLLWHCIANAAVVNSCHCRLFTFFLSFLSIQVSTKEHQLLSVAKVISCSYWDGYIRYFLRQIYAEIYRFLWFRFRWNWPLIT